MRVSRFRVLCRESFPVQLHQQITPRQRFTNLHPIPRRRRRCPNQYQDRVHPARPQDRLRTHRAIDKHQHAPNRGASARRARCTRAIVNVGLVTRPRTSIPSQCLGSAWFPAPTRRTKSPTSPAASVAQLRPKLTGGIGGGEFYSSPAARDTLLPVKILVLRNRSACTPPSYSRAVRPPGRVTIS